jgi:hypothetical protein
MLEPPWGFETLSLGCSHSQLGMPVNPAHQAWTDGV